MRRHHYGNITFGALSCCGTHTKEEPESQILCKTKPRALRNHTKEWRAPTHFLASKTCAAAPNYRRQTKFVASQMKQAPVSEQWKCKSSQMHELFPTFAKISREIPLGFVFKQIARKINQNSPNSKIGKVTAGVCSFGCQCYIHSTGVEALLNGTSKRKSIKMWWVPPFAVTRALKFDRRRAQNDSIRWHDTKLNTLIDGTRNHHSKEPLHELRTKRAYELPRTTRRTKEASGDLLKAGMMMIWRKEIS